MTLKQKFIEDHPGMSDFDLGYAIGAECPSAYGYSEPPKACQGSCEDCWNSELPKEEEEIPICKELKEVGIDTPEKLLKAYGVMKNGESLQPDDPMIIPGAGPLMPIKDSGDRTAFSTGAVRDLHEGKGRMDLLPWTAIMEVAKHCENGAKKYGEHNVDKGIPTNSLCDSAARHLAKYLEGWTDEPHLVAAAWNLLWAIQMEVKCPEVVNTPWKKKEES